MYKWTIASLVLNLLLPVGLAQDDSGPTQGVYSEGKYTDAKTGIAFTTWATQTMGGHNFTFGLVLPTNAATVNATEYIGLLRCQTSATNATAGGWCGIAHAGHMPKALLLMAWPYQDKVLSSLRWADDYFEPIAYSNNGTDGPILTSISSSIRSRDYEFIYRCQNCFSWAVGDYNETVATTEGAMMVGYAHAVAGPRNPGCPAKISIDFHEDGFGQWLAQLGNATSPSYSKWAALATNNVSVSC